MPDAGIESLAGQAHEGMTTAPELFVETVERFLLGDRDNVPARANAS